MDTKDTENFAANKTVLVTGATDGIGKELATALTKLNARVIIHGRDKKKLDTTAKEIRKNTGVDVEAALIADFSSLNQIRQMAEYISFNYGKLQIIVNNAGVYAPHETTTEDGLELTFQVNYVAPFLLTNLLTDILEQNPPARVVNVTSTLHKRAYINVNKLGIPPQKDHYEGHDAYSTSKLALTMFTYEYSRRSNPSKISCFCVHPGAVNTKLLKRGFGSYGFTPKEGAEPIIQLITNPNLQAAAPRYYERSNPAIPDARVLDVNMREQLWHQTEILLKTAYKQAA